MTDTDLTALAVEAQTRCLYSSAGCLDSGRDPACVMCRVAQALRTAANWQSQCALNLHKLKYTEAERDALQARIDAAPGPELTWGDAEIQVVSYTHWWHTQGPGANK